MVFSAFNNFCCSFPNLYLFLRYLHACFKQGYTKMLLSRTPQREMEWLTVFFSSERNTLKFIASDTLLYRGNICRQESVEKVIQHCISKEFIQHEQFGQKLEMKEKNSREVFFPCSCVYFYPILLQYA